MQAVDVEEVVEFKVRKAFDVLKKPVMIEDTGLYVRSWNGLPGALIKWFVTYMHEPGICQMLNNFPDRSAWAKTAVGTYDGVSEPVIFVGRVDGRIALAPAGDHGFGWDKIFIPNGSERTFGEMSSEEKDYYSMRRSALIQMFQYYTET
ncbi:MAG: non-canonical purine NTP pyrophosphatase [Chloroflexales bacterium]